jgi:hypothetical protein
MSRKTFLAAVIATLGLVGGAGADDVGIALNAGSLGVGAQAGFAVADHVGLRANLNLYDYTTTRTEQDVEYNAKAHFKSLGVLGDLYPFGGVFHLTAGVYWNGTKVDATGRPTAGTYEINGQTYPASAIGTLTGKASFDREVVPYLGLGWGRLGGRNGLKVLFDVGALYMGTPTATLTGTCGVAIVGTPTCAQLQQDVAAEEAKVNDDIGDFKWYPVVSLAVGFAF